MDCTLGSSSAPSFTITLSSPQNSSADESPAAGSALSGVDKVAVTIYSDAAKIEQIIAEAKAAKERPWL